MNMSVSERDVILAIGRHFRRVSSCDVRIGIEADRAVFVFSMALHLLDVASRMSISDLLEVEVPGIACPFANAVVSADMEVVIMFGDRVPECSKNMKRAQKILLNP